MKKADLIATVAANTGLTKKDAERAINATVAAITDAICKGDKVQLPGFGIFETKHREERTGRNPVTKQAITIPAANAPVFKASKTLKDAVNK